MWIEPSGLMTLNWFPMLLSYTTLCPCSQTRARDKMLAIPSGCSHIVPYPGSSPIRLVDVTPALQWMSMYVDDLQCCKEAWHCENIDCWLVVEEDPAVRDCPTISVFFGKLLAHDISELSPHQGKDGLDVFSHVHSALNIFIDTLLPNMRWVIWLWRLNDPKVFNCHHMCTCTQHKPRSSSLSCWTDLLVLRLSSHRYGLWGWHIYLRTLSGDGHCGVLCLLHHGTASYFSFWLPALPWRLKPCSHQVRHCQWTMFLLKIN